MIRSTRFVEILILTSLCIIYDEKEADARDITSHDMTNNVKIESCETELMDDSIKTAMENVKDLNNKLSEHLVKRSSNQTVKNKNPTESCSRQKSMRDILEDIRKLALSVKDIKLEIKALTSIVQGNKQDTDILSSRLYFLPGAARQDLEYSLIYTDEMRQSVHGKTVEFGLPVVLCNSRGVFIIDWNTFKSYDWRESWTTILDGKNDDLWSTILLPGNGMLVRLEMESQGATLNLTARYSNYNKNQKRPSSIKIYFHIKLIIQNKNGSTSTFTIKYQQTQIVNDVWSRVVTFSSLVWSKFSGSKLPILEIHLISMEDNQ